MSLLIRLLALSLPLVVLVGCSSAVGLAQEAPSPRSSSPVTLIDPPPSLPSVSPTNDPSCPVTIANRSTPPGERPNHLQHGNGTLWTELWLEGKVLFRPGGPGQVLPDGSLSMKFPWWRGEGVRGVLTIQGRRLDATAPSLSADIPEGYGDSGFQASGIIFPSEGCWEVTGKASNAELTFVTLVVKAREDN